MKRDIWLIIISGILYGTITPGAQLFINKGFGALEISFFRSFFAILILLPVVIRYKNFLPSKKAIPFFILYGLNGALLEIMMFASLGLKVPVALVSLLLYSQPVWTIFLGKFFLDEEINRKKIISAVVGLCGVAILVKSWEVSSIESLLGISLAVGAGFLLSIWVILGKKSANLNQHYITTTFNLSLFSSIWLLIFFSISSAFLIDSEIFRISFSFIVSDWFPLLIFALISGILPHLLFYKGVMSVAGSIAGIILLLEPATATVLADIIFDQKIGFELVIGGALILLSNYFVLRNN